MLATIVQQYHLALVPGQRIEPEPLVTLRPHDGIWMEIGARPAEREPQLAEAQA